MGKVVEEFSALDASEEKMDTQVNKILSSKKSLAGGIEVHFYEVETESKVREIKSVSRYDDQGNWIPHKLRPGTEDGIFFVGDSAGQCLPLTAEGIRTAFYFGIKLGDELRAVVRRGFELVHVTEQTPDSTTHAVSSPG